MFLKKSPKINSGINKITLAKKKKKGTNKIYASWEVPKLISWNMTKKGRYKRSSGEETQT